MSNPMQSRSATITEVTALADQERKRWFTKAGTVIKFSVPVSGFILKSGLTEGVLSCRLEGDNDFITLPIVESDTIAPLPSIREVDLSATTCDNAVILLGD